MGFPEMYECHIPIAHVTFNSRMVLFAAKDRHVLQMLILDTRAMGRFFGCCMLRFKSYIRNGPVVIPARY